MQDNRNADRLMTPAEVAAFFRVDAKTVTRWAQAGRLASIRTLGGHRRYKESDVLAARETQECARTQHVDAHTSTASTSDTEALARAYTDALTIADNIGIKWDRNSGDYTATVWHRTNCRAGVADSPAEALTEATGYLREYLAGDAR